MNLFFSSFKFFFLLIFSSQKAFLTGENEKFKNAFYTKMTCKVQESMPARTTWRLCPKEFCLFFQFKDLSIALQQARHTFIFGLVYQAVHCDFGLSFVSSLEVASLTGTVYLFLYLFCLWRVCLRQVHLK